MRLSMTTIAQLREASSLLRAAGWSVREGATHSRGSVDLAAQRVWTRGEIEAVVHLLIVIDDAEGELAFLQAEGKVDHAPLTFSLGDETSMLDRDLAAQLHALAYRREQSITSAAQVDAPKARRRATWSSGDFTRAFAALDGVRNDLLKLSIDTLSDDLELLDADDAEAAIAPFARRRDLLHAIAITSQTMRTKTFRLEQARVVGADYRWIDVVSADSFADFTDALTRHYTARFAKRRFTAA